MTTSRPNTLIDLINCQLPQTQCGKCGFNGCLPYARAIADGAAINRCPPGGDSTIMSLANLLGRSVVPLDPQYGQHLPPRSAVIRELECIGCTKCIQACPVDAILGAARVMHTVVDTECTGCDLCIDPCPVDCIDMIERHHHGKSETHYAHSIVNSNIVDNRLGSVQEIPSSDLARARQKRFEFHQLRLEREAGGKRGARKRSLSSPVAGVADDMNLGKFSREQAKLEIADAVARVKSRRLKNQYLTDENK